jgi:hypothetical protein
MSRSAVRVRSSALLFMENAPLGAVLVAPTT